MEEVAGLSLARMLSLRWRIGKMNFFFPDRKSSDHNGAKQTKEASRPIAHDFFLRPVRTHFVSLTYDRSSLLIKIIEKQRPTRIIISIIFNGTMAVKYCVCVFIYGGGLT